jgi:c-di-GMP-binding flagellar brake protein YcgR
MLLDGARTCADPTGRSNRVDVEKPEPERRRLIVEAGHLLILHPNGPAGGYPMVAPVDHVADGLHWFLGACTPLERGETLIVESPIQNDARYSTSAKVVSSTPETFALRIAPEWRRLQQRAFVRISAHGLQVRVVRQRGRPAGTEGEADSPCEAVHELLDLSAGGIRIRSGTDYVSDEEVVVHLELPGAECFVLPARVVRNPNPAAPVAGRTNVAIAFIGLDEATRSQLLRWVYREQVRRHRDGLRQRADR